MSAWPAVNPDSFWAIDLYCSLIKETILDAKKAAPVIETKKTVDKKEKTEKIKTVAELDRDKLDKKFSKTKKKELN